MNQTAVMAVAAMLDQFGARGNPDLALASFEEVLQGVPDQVIVETAHRFKAGEVDGQSLDFAPTSARFAQEARRIAELRSYANRPRLYGPKEYRHPGGLRPFEVLIEKARAKYEDWDVHQKGVSYDEFRALWKTGQLPAGATWSPTLATIFVPKSGA